MAKSIKAKRTEVMSVPHSMTLEARLLRIPHVAANDFPEHLVLQGPIGGRTTGVPCAPTIGVFSQSLLHRLSSLATMGGLR